MVNINIHKLLILKAGWLNLHIDYIWNVWNIIFFHPDGLPPLSFNDCSPWIKHPWSFHSWTWKSLVLGRPPRINLKIAPYKAGKEYVREKLRCLNQNDVESIYVTWETC